MSKTRKVGNLFTHEDKKGFTYIQTYFVASTDEGLYTPVYGQAGDKTPFDFPGKTYVYDWEKKPAADHLIITIKCHNDGYDDGGGLSGFTGPTDAQRRFGLKSLFLDPAWWGIIVAGKTDTGEIKRIEKGDAAEGDYDEETIKAKINIHNVACREGDYIYQNARPGLKGTINYANSPYTTASMDTMDPTIWAGKTIKTLTYNVVFYTNKDIMTFLNWNGVNGNGEAYFTPPNDGGCVPTGVTAEGKWKAIDTIVLEDAQSFSGVLYHSVSRDMELAPDTLVWDKDKNSGGIWTW